MEMEVHDEFNKPDNAVAKAKASDSNEDDDDNDDDVDDDDNDDDDDDDKMGSLDDDNEDKEDDDATTAMGNMHQKLEASLVSPEKAPAPKSPPHASPTPTSVHLDHDTARSINRLVKIY